MEDFGFSDEYFVANGTDSAVATQTQELKIQYPPLPRNEWTAVRQLCNEKKFSATTKIIGLAKPI
jgi:hypothetical protein